MSKDTPNFKRPNYGRTKRARVKKGWKRPRGKGNKQRQRLAKAGVRVSIGYSHEVEKRGNHPSGFKEVLVHSFKDIENIVNGVIIRIGATVGAKKKIQLVKMATDKKIKVVNPTVNRKKKIKKVKKVKKVVDSKKPVTTDSKKPVTTDSKKPVTTETKKPETKKPATTKPEIKKTTDPKKDNNTVKGKGD